MHKAMQLLSLPLCRSPKRAGALACQTSCRLTRAQRHALQSTQSRRSLAHTQQKQKSTSRTCSFLFLRRRCLYAASRLRAGQWRSTWASQTQRWRNPALGSTARRLRPARQGAGRNARWARQIRRPHDGRVGSLSTSHGSARPTRRSARRSATQEPGTQARCRRPAHQLGTAAYSRA